MKDAFLVSMTRPKILQILARFCDEFKKAGEGKLDITSFLDRIMEDLRRPDKDDDPVEFDMRRLEGQRFKVIQK